MVYIVVFFINDPIVLTLGTIYLLHNDPTYAATLFSRKLLESFEYVPSQFMSRSYLHM